MTSTTKSLIFGPVLGIVAFLVIGYIRTQTFHVPSNGTDLAELIIIIAAAMATGLLSAGPAVVAAAAQEETGTVKWFSVKRGYGFITRDMGDDVFVHFRSIQGEGNKLISEGQRVCFVVVPSEKGPQAEEVRAL